MCDAPFRRRSVAARPKVHLSIANKLTSLLLGKCKSDTVLVGVPNGVIFPEERIAQDPNRDTRVHTLDAQLALLVAVLIGGAKHIELWLEVERFAAKFEGDSRKSV